MNKMIKKMKDGFRIELMSQDCCYCNNAAKYLLKTGFFITSSRPICNKCRIQLTKQIDEVI